MSLQGKIKIIDTDLLIPAVFFGQGDNRFQIENPAGGALIVGEKVNPDRCSGLSHQTRGRYAGRSALGMRHPEHDHDEEEVQEDSFFIFHFYP
jgi:hypothetical protein